MPKTIAKRSFVVLLSLLVVMIGRETVSQRISASTEGTKESGSEQLTPSVTRNPPIIQRTGGIVQPLADGSRNPELISDEVALKALLLNIALPPKPDAGQLDRLRVRTGRMMLDERDFALLTQELGRFYGLMTGQRARIAAAQAAVRMFPTPASFEKVVEADRQMNSLVKDSYNVLLRDLSPDGQRKLQNHVSYVKTRIKIIPPPDMSQKHH